jgi:hypothetical protein
MKEILINNIGSFVIFAGSLLLFYQWKRDYNQREIENKKREKEREDDIKRREKENRREFLVDMIRDEKAPVSARIEAGNEYLKEGYNGVVKKYILDNQYYDKNAFNNS